VDKTVVTTTSPLEMLGIPDTTGTSEVVEDPDPDPLPGAVPLLAALVGMAEALPGALPADVRGTVRVTD
jgi:hypothetical protein